MRSTRDEDYIQTCVCQTRSGGPGFTTAREAAGMVSRALAY